MSSNFTVFPVRGFDIVHSPYTGDAAYETNARVGAVVHDGYLSAPEGYRPVMIHPYAFLPATPHYMYSDLPASASETLYTPYASYDPRPSQVLVPPLPFSREVLLVPSPPLAFSQTHSYFPSYESYEPVYPTFAAAPADAPYFYPSQPDPYPQHPPFGLAEVPSPEFQRTKYPISSNVT